FFSFQYYCAHQDLHSFPTRRSSDLFHNLTLGARNDMIIGISQTLVKHRLTQSTSHKTQIVIASACGGSAQHEAISLSEIGLLTRSEEHTSELQSRGHLVCRLLLEKK